MEPIEELMQLFKAAEEEQTAHFCKPDPRDCPRCTSEPQDMSDAQLRKELKEFTRRWTDEDINRMRRRELLDLVYHARDGKDW